MEFGDFELFLLSDGTYKPDGGTMFGAIPKVLWSKLEPADELNRIVLGLGVLLVRTGEANIIIDTGIGEKLEAKWAKIYGLNRSKHLLDHLNEVELGPEDIDVVILTHLHFDHAGGNTRLAEDGKVVPTFPKAKYFIQKGEWEYALNPDLRSRVGYMPENFLPIEQAGLLRLVDGNTEIVRGVQVMVTGGHTPSHQVVKIESKGKTAFHLGDLVPTASHLKVPYVTGYDLYPLGTMRMKERLLREALMRGWLVIFGHDTRIGMGYLKEKGDEIVVGGV